MSPLAPTDRVRLPHMPALDGLRALAVAAVILYHAGAAFMPGGFLGVELFFVLSGFLIASLLRASGGASGQAPIALGEFWRRRARRLLPAAYTLVVVVLVAVRFGLPSELPSLRGDGLAGLAYVSNWWLILENKSYFEQAGRPSLLQHLWSLAVEAQFYLVFPLLYVGLLARLRAGVSAVACGLIAICGALWMGVRFDPDMDPSALYYGTDTRAAGLLVGAALAFLRKPRGQEREAPVYWATPAAGVGLLVVGLSCVHVSEYDEALYRGGLLAFSVVCGVLIAALLDDPTGAVSRVLSTPALQAIGRRSYSLYLWHWPVLMVSRPHQDVALSGPVLWLLQGLATVVLAELSYCYVETPIREGALSRWVVDARRRTRPAERMAVVFAVSSCTLSAIAVGSVVVDYQPPVTAETLSRLAVNGDGEEAYGPLPLNLATPPCVDCEGSAERGREHAPTEPRGPRPRLVLAIGDSVMRGAALELRRQRDLPVVIDAVVGRQVSQSLRLVKDFLKKGRLAPLVVVHLGNNGTFRARQFERMMRLLGPHRQVLFVNTKVPRRWQDPNNQVIAEGVKRHRNASLLDWHSVSVERPEWFARDGYHLKREGAKAYAELLSEHCYLPSEGGHAMLEGPAGSQARFAQLAASHPLTAVRMEL